MKAVASSFGWPFRHGWQARIAVGALMVLLLPIAFIPLLGYAIAATRRAEENPAQGPPPWRLSGRLITDGFWTATALLVLSAPFLLAFNPLADWISVAHAWQVSDPTQSQAYAYIAAALVLALPWGLWLLLVMPHASSTFATTGRPQDLFDFLSALRAVWRDFPTWNVAAAAIVTGWVVGVACVGLLCVGIVPGIFYAILVSAYACAQLHSPKASGPNLSSG